MPGYGSQDELISKITQLGQYKRIEMNKLINPAHTATAGWHATFTLPGYPNAGTFPAAQDLVLQSPSELAGDGTVFIGPQHNGLVGPSAKKLCLNFGANIIAAAGAPWQVKIVDLVGYYRLSGANITGTGSRVLINSNTVVASSSAGLLLTYANDFTNLSKVRFTNSGGALPTGLALATDYWLVRAGATTGRVATSLENAVAGATIAFTDAGTGTHTMAIQNPRYQNGVGCEAMFVAQTQPTAGGPTLSASSYTNTAGTPGRAFQGGVTLGATADAYATRILHSGNAAGRYGPYLPRQGADTGIQSIQSFTWSGGTAYTGTGVGALCIVKSLGDVLIPASGMYSERDFVNQFPSFPEVPDNACLGFLIYSTGATSANSPFTANLDVGWA